MDTANRFSVKKFSDVAVEVVREKILSGELAPGQRINEIALSEELQISRSPLREALRDLTSEGLVTMSPGKGSFVASFDIETVTQIGEIRLTVECAVARFAAERADDSDRAELKQMIGEIEEAIAAPDRPYPHHLNFHHLLGRATKNPRLSQLSDEVERQLRLARIASGNSPTRAREVLAEHRAISDAVLAGDVERADREMRFHITASNDAIIALIVS
jgi:DNA-binding GntR family transcriptional regulator